MNPLSFEYQISIREYHTALYFGLVTRYRRMVWIFVAVSAVALGCFLGEYLGLMPPVIFPACIFLGYLVWILFCLARVEHGVLKMTKSPDNPLAHKIRLEFTRDAMKVETPHNGEKAVHPLQNLFLVFELSNLFVIYLDGMNTILLPLRTMDAKQRAALRETFRDNLHDRFQTRFNPYKTPKIQSLTGGGRKRRFF